MSTGNTQQNKVSTQIHIEFNEWYEQQIAAGLQDIKFAMGNTVSESAISRNVLHELLTAERMIDAGIIEEHLDVSNTPA